MLVLVTHVIDLFIPLVIYGKCHSAEFPLLKFSPGNYLNFKDINPSYFVDLY